MKRLILTILVLLFCLIGAYGQIFWTQDFEDGIPNDWSNLDDSGIGILWSYCPDTTNYGNPSNQNCPFNFNDVQNGFQVKFKSDTPENGFATCSLGSLFVLTAQTPFQSSLTTGAISCKEKEEVYLTFNSHIGVFTKNASTNARVNISTDGKNWTSFYPHPSLLAGENPIIGFKKWSRNPEKVVLDISSVASNQDSIFIQWSWCGNDEYHWSIDDLILTDENPIQSIDLTLSPSSNFHAIMPNYETPESQIDTVFFMTDLANIGSNTQSNFDVIARVTDLAETETLYEEKSNIASLEPGITIENIEFPPYYHTSGPGEYKVVYTTSNSSEDANPENNLYEYPFLISTNTFSKHKATKQIIELYPRDLNQNNTVETNWSMANYFYLPEGENMFVDEVIFEIPFRFEEEIGEENYVINSPNINVDISMYEWNDLNDINHASPEELTRIGTTNYTVSGDDGSTPNKVKLENTISKDLNIPLKDNQSYILAIEYTSTLFNRLFAVKANAELNYDAMISVNASNDKNRFAAMSKVGDTDDFNTFAFGGDIIPHIGFSITPSSGVSTRSLYVENGLNIFPNPVHKKATVEILIPNRDEAILELSTLAGKILKQISLAKDQSMISFDCSGLPNATYMLAFKSDTAIALERLVILH